MSDRNLTCDVLMRHKTLSDVDVKVSLFHSDCVFRFTVVRHCLMVPPAFKKGEKVDKLSTQRRVFRTARVLGSILWTLSSIQFGGENRTNYSVPRM